MKNEDLIEALEKVNYEYLMLMNSKEYIVGKKIIKFFDNLKKLKFKQIFDSAWKNRKKGKVDGKPNLIFFEPTNFCKIQDYNNKKTVVYTCIVGNYDSLSDPYIKSDDFDYVVYTNQEVKSNFWKKREIPEYIKDIENPILINRYIKMHPNELFKDYDYSIYVDGKVTIISDLSGLLPYTSTFFGIAMHRHAFRDDVYEEIDACIAYGKGNKEYLNNQKNFYRKQKMPRSFGMLEAAVIVTDLSNENGVKLLNDWWLEFIRSKSLRDQIALPYVIWKSNRTIGDIGNLGVNIEKNPKFRIDGNHQLN